jgi:hypothetical protein
VPEISRFFGIIIAMFAKDHVPPHFHAKYGEFKATFDINTGELLDGNLPGRAIRLFQDWAELHKEELLKIGMKAKKIIPTLNLLNH